MATTYAVTAATMSAGLTGTFVKTPDLGAAISATIASTLGQNSYTNGTGTGQVDKILPPQLVSIAPSGSASIDLAGSVADSFGNTITMAKLKGLLVIMPETVSGGTQASGVTMGAGSACMSTIFADTSDKINILKGGFLALCAGAANGYTVTATTADKVFFDNVDSSNTATLYVYGIGTSA